MKEGSGMMTKKIYSIEEIKELIEQILINTEVERAILFGSYAKKIPTQNSDIDILIDSEGKIKGLKFFSIMETIKEVFNKDVDVIEKSEIDEGSKIEDEIKKTGVLIYERQNNS